MLKITIDCNSDIIIFNDIAMKIKYSNQMIEILKEVLNRIPNLSGVILEKIDEDTRVTIGEW